MNLSPATTAQAASRRSGHPVCQLRRSTVEIGGKTYNVKLEIVDNESSNDKAVSAASQLVSKGVSVVLGSYGSGVSIAASDTFKNAGVPAIGVTCTNPAVTAGNSHYFRSLLHRLLPGSPSWQTMPMTT